MSQLVTSAKVRADHLGRRALIYVRQSTLMQVRTNTGSTARQYDLVQRARALGWASDQIAVIDQDQGRSGASVSGRDGFQALVAEVGLGHAGAVLSLEVSRLARSCSDWYRLIEICALAETLVIDEEGVYDPGQYNDRLLLGFKGTMSEAELHWLRLRLLGGKLEKAQQGTLRMRVPVGLVHDANGQVVLDPDEQVQQAVRLAFTVFAQCGSAVGVVAHFGRRHLLFPVRCWGGARDGEVVWEPLTHGRMLAVLHNPAYAGAYVYGRTKTKHPLPGHAPRVKGITRQVPRADWTVHLPDAHPGYLTWEDFERNQRRLEDNRTNQPEQQRGAPREGAALLQGIILCGRCGRRMSVRYLADGCTPIYACARLHKDAASPTCQSMRGDGIDAAVADAFLAAMQPAHLAIALATLEHLTEQARLVDRQWQLRLERARYEADRVGRQYRLVEPENRVVARTLEREWNERLTAVEALEREYAALPSPTAHLTSPADHQRILALAQDLPAIWHAATTTQADRKQLLRFLIKDLTLTRTPTALQVGLRWQTEALSTLLVPLPVRSADARRTPVTVVARVQALAPDHTDAQIATLLRQEGATPGLGGHFTTGKVQWIRHRYAIPTGCPERPMACPTGQRSDGRYSARAAADLLNVDVSTIAAWCVAGLLDAVSTRPHGPRWIALPPETIVRLRKPARRCWSRRRTAGADDAPQEGGAPGGDHHEPGP